MMQTEREIAGARAAARAGIPFSLSTMGRSSIEDVKAANPHGRNWFQLYMWKGRDRWSGTVDELLDTMFDPSVTFEDLAWIKGQWPGKVVVKGVQNLSDARKLADLGVDGIVLSNHGGRQLDRALIPFHLLPQVVREVGKDTEVHLDTGIMSGADVVASVALGARFTLIGRAYLYGLMAGGEAGVDRAIQILSEQVARTMRLLGVNSPEELEPGHVTQLARLSPIAAAAPHRR